MGSPPATTPEAGTQRRHDAPRETLFTSSHLGPMRTSLTSTKRMPAHGEQAPGSKKPIFVQAATPSSQTLLGWEPGLRRCPLRVALRLSPMLRWVPVCPGWAGQGMAQRNLWERARRACHLC